MIAPEVITPGPPDKPAPLIAEAFRDLAVERGWRIVADYAYEIEVDGEIYGGFWDLLLVRQEHHGDDLWHWQIRLNESIAQGHPAVWDAIIRLGDMEWDRKFGTSA